MNSDPKMDKKTEVEQRYIALLEKRIAQLEALLASDSPGKKDGKADIEAKAESTDAKKTNGTVAEANGKENDSETPDKDSKSELSRIEIVVNRVNVETGIREDIPMSELSKETPKKEKPTPEREIAFTFRRVMNSDGKKFSNSEVDVKSLGLRTLLKETLIHYPSKLFEEESVNLQGGTGTPFSPLVYNWKALEDAAKADEGDSKETEQAKKDLIDLMIHVKTSPELEAYFKTREAHLASGTITFDYLWTIFSPGTQVIARPFMNDAQIFEVERVEKITKDGGYAKVKVIAAGYDWNGVKFQRTNYGLEIWKFDGPKQIPALPVYPLAYYEDDHGYAGPEILDRLKSSIIERGRKFYQYCTRYRNGVLCEYDGLVVGSTKSQTLSATYPDDDQQSLKSIPDDSLLSSKRRVVRIKAKIIVDGLSYLRSGRNEVCDGTLPLGDLEAGDGETTECQCSDCRNSPSRMWRSQRASTEEDDTSEHTFENSDERLLLCPPRVLGYVFDHKLWAQFRLKDIKRVADQESSDLFDNKLELNDDYKKWLKAYINNHKSSNNYGGTKGKPPQVTDLIENKGRGLVILLHGPPGVGKTLTAETIALASGRPLFPVSVAEIGMEPQKAEQNLNEIFSIAARWESVLLIDEADVFLESRLDSNDITRNALVSVLLRVLEYFQGIIILTTNRITSLDVAVQSRIHLAIQYKDLEPNQKENIFKTFLDQIDKSEIGSNRDCINAMLRKHCKKWMINGRQIRNIVSSAQSLARASDEKLSWDHIETAYDITNDFLKCLEKLWQRQRMQNEACD
ncbi:MAG: hypothetical protein M1839_004463 [Geoglossum umbratile]|nr:MAG: hypothetical protein M1839_004463 [Geoglossum umbratile]